MQTQKVTTNEKHVPLLDIFTKALSEQGYQTRTIEDYCHAIKLFVNWLDKENLSLATCTYPNVLSWVKTLKARDYSTSLMNTKIRGIRYLYEILKKHPDYKDSITHNPTLHLTIKGVNKRLPNALLSREQLESLYVASPETTDMQQRNKLILSMFIGQALRLEEIHALEPHHIDLEKGIIHIPKTGRHNRRILQLEARQILPLNKYLTETRIRMLDKVPYPKTRLFFSYGSSQSIKDSLKDYLKYLKKKEPLLRNFLHIRVSVITSWAEEKSIRETQYLAGHGNIISTEPYKMASVKDVKQAINKYHPMK